MAGASFVEVGQAEVRPALPAAAHVAPRKLASAPLLLQMSCPAVWLWLRAALWSVSKLLSTAGRGSRERLRLLLSAGLTA